jgi:anaphase-promoting complex subunit 6
VYYRVITEDPYHVGCLPVFIACLIEMGKVTGICPNFSLNKTKQDLVWCLHEFYVFIIIDLELFRIAHKLVEVTSDSALAWYSVGAYYFLIGRSF